MTNSDILWIAIVAVPLALVALAKLVLFIVGFSKELRYIRFEIARNTGEERAYWISEKRRLWLSLLPFIKY